ncbi:hypothetical protein MMC26_003461 [Xylographa opegraphella]|nr:hypothetical protein [Xylographa opegraphella]
MSFSPTPIPESAVQAPSSSSQRYKFMLINWMKLTEYSSYYGSPIISVVVGTGHHSVTFNVHRDLICAESNYFSCACSKMWLVGNSVILPEDDPALFRRLLDWLYSKSYTGHLDALPMGTEVRTYFLLGVLADKLQVSKLITQMGDWTDAQIKAIPGYHTVAIFKVKGLEAQYVYQNTTPLSRLRVSLTRMVANEIMTYDAKYWQKRMREDSEFAFDLVAALRWRLESSNFVLQEIESHRAGGGQSV